MKKSLIYMLGLATALGMATPAAPAAFAQDPTFQTALLDTLSDKGKTPGGTDQEETSFKIAPEVIEANPELKKAANEVKTAIDQIAAEKQTLLDAAQAEEEQASDAFTAADAAFMELHELCRWHDTQISEARNALVNLYHYASLLENVANQNANYDLPGAAGSSVDLFRNKFQEAVNNALHLLKEQTERFDVIFDMAMHGMAYQPAINPELMPAIRDMIPAMDDLLVTLNYDSPISPENRNAYIQFLNTLRPDLEAAAGVDYTILFDEFDDLSDHLLNQKKDEERMVQAHEASVDAYFKLEEKQAQTATARAPYEQAAAIAMDVNNGTFKTYDLEGYEAYNQAVEKLRQVYEDVLAGNGDDETVDPDEKEEPVREPDDKTEETKPTQPVKKEETSKPSGTTTNPVKTAATAGVIGFALVGIAALGGIFALSRKKKK